MKVLFRSIALLLLVATAAQADVSPKQLYTDVTPSLVAVQFQFTGETINRELVGPGIVVGSDGLVMTPLALFNVLLPDEQLKDFKIIIPSQTKDAEEIDAEFVGRDERTAQELRQPVDGDVPARHRPSWARKRMSPSYSMRMSGTP